MIRLNPNIPFKTRGNGAVALRLYLRDENSIVLIKSIIEETLEKYLLLSGKTSPAVVIHRGTVGSSYRYVYLKALHDIVLSSVAKEIVKKNDDLVIMVNKGRGIIGAVAAIGAYPLVNFTYELIVYREFQDRSRMRGIDKNSVLGFDRIHRPETFGNYDFKHRRVLITPHGPDPVLVGVRSCNLEELLSALKVIKVIDGKSIGEFEWIIFRTNQGTDAHLKRSKDNSKSYKAVSIVGWLKEKPRIIKGGHVVFNLVTPRSTVITCVSYRETGRLRNVLRLLKPGDEIEVKGGIKPWTEGVNLNVEKVRVLRLQKHVLLLNPLCPKCGKRMKSRGRGKGFKCPACGFSLNLSSKEVRQLERIVMPGLFMSDPLAYRHLTKPVRLYGRRFKDRHRLMVMSSILIGYGEESQDI